jgi:proline iminopeptidase
MPRSLDQRNYVLFPPLSPYSSGYLSVSPTHNIYWEQCGNPDGMPVVVLHGGPGAGCTPVHRRFFDPNFYRIILLDQRGAGRSNPLGSLEENTLVHLINDLEMLRVHLRVERWHLYGGSWGSTLGLAYAQTYPDRCRSLVLYGIFLMRAQDIDWFTNGVRQVHPEAHANLLGQLSDKEQAQGVIDAYFDRLNGKDVALKRQAALVWQNYEAVLTQHNALPLRQPSRHEEQQLWAQSLIELHYFKQALAAPVDLLANIDRLKPVPATIIQSRYDMVCPMAGADALHEAWPEADYIIVSNAGHSALDLPMRSRLIEATENAKHWR